MGYVHWFSEFTHWMFSTSLKGAIVVAIILVVRHIFFYRFSAKWIYALWFLLIIRLMLPFELSSPISIFNLTKGFSEHIKISKITSAPLRVDTEITSYFHLNTHLAT